MKTPHDYLGYAQCFTIGLCFGNAMVAIIGGHDPFFDLSWAAINSALFSLRLLTEG